MTIDLDARAFSFWDPRIGRWVAEPGTFDVLIGRSSEDIIASCSVVLSGSAEARALFTEMSPGAIGWRM